MNIGFNDICFSDKSNKTNAFSCPGVYTAMGVGNWPADSIDSGVGHIDLERPNRFRGRYVHAVNVAAPNRSQLEPKRLAPSSCKADLHQCMSWVEPVVTCV